MEKSKNDYGRFDFVGKVNIFGGISVLLVLVSLVYLGVKGISYGIDFSGGTEVQVRFAQNVSIDELRSMVEELKVPNADLQSFGGDVSEYIIRFRVEQGLSDKEANDRQNELVAQLRAGLDSKFQVQQPEVRRVDSVGPQVGGELKRNGFLAVFYCLLIILIYVALRFDYKYAPGAVICLFHDAVITLAIFIAVGKEVNIPILAAILTLIGYSLNDTIVVFDRIRETEGVFGERGIRFVINRAINDMLERTIITSGTTFVSALCLYIFADGTVSDIAFAMCVGIFFGTYSSIYVAAPFALLMEKMKLLKPAQA